MVVRVLAIEGRVGRVIAAKSGKTRLDKMNLQQTEFLPIYVVRKFVKSTVVVELAKVIRDVLMF
jgi:hypothetical protein